MAVMEISRLASDTDAGECIIALPAFSVCDSGSGIDVPHRRDDAGSYGQKRPRWVLLAAILALHGVAVAGLLMTRFDAEEGPPPQRVTTFAIAEIAPPPPAPPPVEPSQPEPAMQPPVVQASAPTPSIELRTEASLPVALPAELTPVASVTLSLPPMPVGSPAKSAPIVPPDFRASQLDNPGPAYPYLSRKGREEGVVLLRVLVSVDGRAKVLELEKSSGHERLDEAALKTVRKWRFIPASQAGDPREAWVLVPVTFSLG